MNFLPSDPAYYNTQKVSDYISDEDKSVFFSVRNSHYINHLILQIEELFKDSNFLGFEITTDYSEQDEYFFNCTVQHKSASKRDKQKIQKLILNIIKEFCRNTLKDMSSEEMGETLIYLEKSQLCKMVRENRFDNYHAAVQYNADFLIFPDYDNFIHFLKTGISNFTSADTIKVNNIQIPRIFLNIEESEKIKSDLEYIKIWLEEYEKKLKIIEIIKNFDQKKCDKIMLDILSGEPFFYVKDNKKYVFNTDLKINMSDKKIGTYRIINLPLNYSDFRSFHQISNGFSKEKFENTLDLVKAEKEKHLLNKSLTKKFGGLTNIKMTRL